MKEQELVQQKLVQAIGNYVCEECGPDADCGEDPNVCVRIATAIGALDAYIKGLASQEGVESGWAKGITE